jgi:hypothetical protein
MRLGLLGTGMVARTLATKLLEQEHDIFIGTRNPEQTLSRTKPDVTGNPPFGAWSKQYPRLLVGTYADTASFGELLFNATAGGGSLEALTMAGEANLNGKILIDLANPLDFSRGMPPALTIVNTDSLGEQIQRRFPGTKVVKTLNTINASLMVNPGQLANGDHHIFVSGNDAKAKNEVIYILKNWFGWKHIIDLGDITTARGTEMYLPLWLRMWEALQTHQFNIKIVK